MKNVFQNIEECIGETPVIELKTPLLPSHKKLFLKLEFFNPTFSIKDRTALGLVKDAFVRDQLKLGGTIIESTSGNLGKSLAMLGASMGFKVILVIDPKAPQTMINWCQAYGATVVLVDTPDQFGGYQSARINKVRELLQQHPNAYWPNQYDNAANPNFHYHQTATEILNLKLDAVCGAVSTGGHLSGIAKNLRTYRDDISILGCDVKGSAIFGEKFQPYLLNGVGLAWQSANTNLTLLDHHTNINDNDAISMCHLIARENGVLLGGSGGLTVFAALGYLLQDYSDHALAIIADSGINYLHQIYDDAWLKEHEIMLSSADTLQQKLIQLNFTALAAEPINVPA